MIFMQKDHPYPLWNPSHTKSHKFRTSCKLICRATLKFVGRKFSETVPFTYTAQYLLPRRRMINILNDHPSVVSRLLRQICRDCCRTIARYGKIKTAVDRRVVFRLVATHVSVLLFVVHLFSLYTRILLWFFSNSFVKISKSSDSIESRKSRQTASMFSLITIRSAPFSLTLLASSA